MPEYTDPLAHVRIAAPCKASWERMSGNESVRFCAQCNLNVYNLSGMTRKKAEALIINSEGRLCARFYRRADGTILTGNCPVGLRALKRRVSRVTNALFSSVLSFFAGVGVNFALTQSNESFAPSGRHMMGEIAEQGSPLPPPQQPLMGAVRFEPVMDEGELGRVTVSPVNDIQRVRPAKRTERGR